MVMFYALAALCFSSSALAQIAGWGRCPEIESMPNFNLSEINGKWYEARRYFLVTETTVKCVTYDYRTDENGENGTTLLDTSAISLLTGRLRSIEGIEIRSLDEAEPGKLEIKLPSSTVWNNYLVLGTDYKSYMVIYRCVDLKLINLKYLWISTRMQRPPEAAIVEAVKVVQQQELDKKQLITTDQKDCEL